MGSHFLIDISYSFNFSAAVKQTIVTMNKDTAVTLSIGLVVGALLSAVVGAVVDSKKKKASLPVRSPGAKSWRMSKWVKHNGIICTQGLVGDFNKIPGSSTAEQTAEALQKLDDILVEAGVTRRHLLAVKIFIADISDKNFQEMNAVYDKWVDPESLPTRICVEANLGPGFAIEIQAEAYCED